MTIKGIDVSKHQKAGKVNFEELKKLGYDFVIVRAGYGKVFSHKKTQPLRATTKRQKRRGYTLAHITTVMP